MNRYKLSVDKTVNSMDTLEVETNLSETELDALLDKIEKTDNKTTAEYIKKLQNNGIRIRSISANNRTCYEKAEVVELERIEEPTVFEYLTELKKQVTDKQFKAILVMTDEDIKFNRVKFGKKTGPRDYISICDMCRKAIAKCL